MLEQEKIVIDNIQKLLKEQAKKRKDLCDYLGVAHTNFGNWASGRNTGYMKMLQKIADYFGVSVGYLLGSEEIKKDLDENSLTEDEACLIDLFRRVPEDKQELLMQMIRLALGTKE